MGMHEVGEGVLFAIVFSLKEESYESICAELRVALGDLNVIDQIMVKGSEIRCTMKTAVLDHSLFDRSYVMEYLELKTGVKISDGPMTGSSSAIRSLEEYACSLDYIYIGMKLSAVGASRLGRVLRNKEKVTVVSLEMDENRYEKKINERLAESKLREEEEERNRQKRDSDRIHQLRFDDFFRPGRDPGDFEL